MTTMNQILTVSLATKSTIGTLLELVTPQPSPIAKWAWKSPKIKSSHSTTTFRLDNDSTVAYSRPECDLYNILSEKTLKQVYLADYRVAFLALTFKQPLEI